MKSINPATGKLIGEYAEHTVNECDEIIEKVHQSWQLWKKTSFEERKIMMLLAAQILRLNKDKFARLMTEEMGKLIKESQAEVEKSAWVCEYYAENASDFLKDEIIKTDAGRSFVSFEPIGPVLAVMPWNFPFWQVFRFAAPALMAGNACVLKHASNVPGCALAIEDIFKEAGFPGNLFRTLMIPANLVENVIKNERIKAVTLTGSELAGSKVAEMAGKYLKKTVLELGGSDPFIVLKDADLEKCATTAVFARMLNCGQSCIAAKRFIVVKDVIKEFTALAKKQIEILKPGDPSNSETNFGPMARPDLVEEIDFQVRNSIGMGANLIMGGKRIDCAGFFYEPTLITGVTPDMPVFNEETFGPAMAIMSVENADDAIKIANSNGYGLGGGIWTKDIEQGTKLARQIESGAVFVNGMTKSDPRLPFGGIKKSGYGRELSHYGIKEFVNIKTIWVG
jgi:succinate-semialdehyde dehydrogenase/glutarate-semialdehyde dehydrogenase